MNLNKSQWEKIASIVLGAALAVFAVAGWVVNPATLLEAPEARLREKISIDARDDAYLYNGADFYVYSDDHATQKMLIDGATGGLTSASTITVTAGGLVISSGSLNMSNGTILNVGNAGTDFDAAGGLTTAYAITVTTGGLNLSNGVASNIGAAGTDFDANGGLTTASTITITAGGLNASNGVISNVGNAGTDFDANGGLTTASTITVTAGGLKISNGNAQINDLIIVDTPAAQTVTTQSKSMPRNSSSVLDRCALMSTPASAITRTASGLRPCFSMPAEVASIAPGLRARAQPSAI